MSDKLEPVDPVQNLIDWAKENDIDTDDPGYIEYLEALKEYESKRCWNTYGDCEVTFGFGNTDFEDKRATIFCKPDEIITEVANTCGWKIETGCKSGKCKKCVGRLISGNIKDEKKHLLTEDEIASGLIVTCGTKLRSKYVTIRLESQPNPEEF
jgi:ferredoxin